jgi:hypothetical protein
MSQVIFSFIVANALRILLVIIYLSVAVAAVVRRAQLGAATVPAALGSSSLALAQRAWYRRLLLADNGCLFGHRSGTSRRGGSGSRNLRGPGACGNRGGIACIRHIQWAPPASGDA